MSPGPLATQASRLAAGEVTSEELAESALARARQFARTVNPFRVLRSEAAMVEARRADQRLAAGERLPLLGVPVAIKDDSDIAGETTPFGCGGDFETKKADGEAVRRLRAAGAIVIGKTHTPELGLYPWTEGPAFPPVRNPWDITRTPGGSSGGSAAAVAAGIVAGAIGSDGAGSVRIPASWSNLVGLKPQRGRVSSWPDTEAFCGLTSIGPLALTAGDTALLLDAICGSHPRDRHQLPPPARPFVSASRSGPARRLRIGLVMKPPFVANPVSVDAAVTAAVRNVAERLAGLGHTVEDASLATWPLGPLFTTLASTGLAGWYSRLPEPELTDPRTQGNARLGRALRPFAGTARALQRPAARYTGRFFRHYEVLLSPVTAVPPLPIGAATGLGQYATERLMSTACPYTWPWNVLGWPALSVPAGFSRDGLPVGAHLAGPEGSEALLLALTAELESVCPWIGQVAPADSRLN